MQSYLLKILIKFKIMKSLLGIFCLAIESEIVLDGKKLKRSFMLYPRFLNMPIQQQEHTNLILTSSSYLIFFSYTI
ncbi:hypothetical protein CHU00_04280 [Sphingobacterium cellulitidis]|nr:hypothetical protein CHU00_04280 [Sphingobacterium cellulitidis]